MESTSELITEESSRNKWIAKFFGNVAAAIVILGGIFTGQGFIGTVMLLFQLMAVMFVLALCAFLVPGARNCPGREQASAVTSVILCLAAVALVFVGRATP
jgi:asparagine N-glycosylation enzyme membrane subunit Stt3